MQNNADVGISAGSVSHDVNPQWNMRMACKIVSASRLPGSPNLKKLSLSRLDLHYSLKLECLKNLLVGDLHDDRCAMANPRFSLVDAGATYQLDRDLNYG